MTVYKIYDGIYKIQDILYKKVLLPDIDRMRRFQEKSIGNIDYMHVFM